MPTCGVVSGLLSHLGVAYIDLVDHVAAIGVYVIDAGDDNLALDIRLYLAMEVMVVMGSW